MDSPYTHLWVMLLPLFRALKVIIDMVADLQNHPKYLWIAQNPRSPVVAFYHLAVRFIAQIALHQPFHNGKEHEPLKRNGRCTDNIALDHVHDDHEGRSAILHAQECGDQAVLFMLGLLQKVSHKLHHKLVSHGHGDELVQHPATELVARVQGRT